MYAQVLQLLMFSGTELWDTSLVLAPFFHFGYASAVTACLSTVRGCLHKLSIVCSLQALGKI